MDQAVGATPPRLPMRLFYGRDMNVPLIQSMLHRLSSEVWSTAEPPDAASPSLVQTASNIRVRLIEEHDATLYDPAEWARVCSWYLIEICTLIIDGRLREANELLCTEEKCRVFQRPAPRLLPRLQAPLPPGNCEAKEQTITEVMNYTQLMKASEIDNLYKRAFLEIHMSKLHEMRGLVDDKHCSLILIDATFYVREEDRIDRDNPVYQQLYQMELATPQQHYAGKTALPYLPHLHAVCRWTCYANRVGMGINIVLAVGNSRCREADSNVTAICWVSEHLCGFFSPQDEMVVDAENVWDMLLLLNQRYVPA